MAKLLSSVRFGSLLVYSPRGASETARRSRLVDDVVTKRATLLAVASRVAEAFPGVRVQAFAVLRTMGLVDDIEKILDPCLGESSWDGQDVLRVP